MRLDIDGMQCEGCAQTIEVVLAVQSGVQLCEVSYATHTARVLYEPALTSEWRLVEALERAGYVACTA